MSELKVNSIESNNTLTANSLVVGNVTINSIGITAPNYVVNRSAIAIGNSSANITITANSSIPSINIGGTTYTSLTTENVNTQLFTANGTWTKPSWATDGKELVVVHMWGGGGGSATTTGANSASGGGGAFVFGYFIASNCNATCNVVVGLGGNYAVNASAGLDTQAGNGTSSIFYANTINSLTAYGGIGGYSNATVHVGGGGGGWLSAGSRSGSNSTGGGPLGGSGGIGVDFIRDSTFGGGSGGLTTPNCAGVSIYGGGGGGAMGGFGGNTVFGGGGGVRFGTSWAGKSIFGGTGGSVNDPAGVPGGGGGGQGDSINGLGARGEVRIYTYRIVS